MSLDLSPRGNARGLLSPHDLDGDGWPGVFRQLSGEARRLVLASETRLRVAVDGAAFAGVEDILAEADVFSTPLFRGPDPLFVSAGPHLVDLYRPARSSAPQDRLVDPPDAADGVFDDEQDAGPDSPPSAASVDVTAAETRLTRLLEIIGPSAHLVFWLGSSEMTHEALHRHLRTLNKVLVPRNEMDHPEKMEEESAVLFRHSDGNVLSQVIPVLSEAQLARLLGPADTLFFGAPDYPTQSGKMAQKAERPEAVRPAGGMLRITAAQVEAIDTRRLTRTKRRIAERMRKVLSDEGATIPADLSGEVDRAVDEGRRIGLRSTASYWRWCTIQVPSRGRIGQDALVRDYMTTERLSVPVEERLDHLTMRLRDMQSASMRRSR